MKAESSFETSTHNYLATQRHISEEVTLTVIAVRASNITEKVFPASSSYYVGFKGKFCTSRE
jgi:hypothetical protein